MGWGGRMPAHARQPLRLEIGELQPRGWRLLWALAKPPPRACLNSACLPLRADRGACAGPAPVPGPRRRRQECRRRPLHREVSRAAGGGSPAFPLAWCFCMVWAAAHCACPACCIHCSQPRWPAQPGTHGGAGAQQHGHFRSLIKAIALVLACSLEEDEERERGITPMYVKYDARLYGPRKAGQKVRDRAGCKCSWDPCTQGQQVQTFCGLVGAGTEAHERQAEALAAMCSRTACPPLCPQEPLSLPFLKKYIAFAKQRFAAPELSPEASDAIAGGCACSLPYPLSTRKCMAPSF